MDATLYTFAALFFAGLISLSITMAVGVEADRQRQPRMRHRR